WYEISPVTYASALCSKAALKNRPPLPPRTATCLTGFWLSATIKRKPRKFNTFLQYSANSIAVKLSFNSPTRPLEYFSFESGSTLVGSKNSVFYNPNCSANQSFIPPLALSNFVCAPYTVISCLINLAYIAFCGTSKSNFLTGTNIAG